MKINENYLNFGKNFPKLFQNLLLLSINPLSNESL